MSAVMRPGNQADLGMVPSNGHECKEKRLVVTNARLQCRNGGSKSPKVR